MKSEYKRQAKDDPMWTLCRMALTIAPEDISADVVDSAKMLFLDTMGVMLGGSGQESVETVVEFVLEQGGKEECAIPFVASQRVPGSMAAFAMGVMVRALDMGSVHEDAIHTTEHILPVVLAATSMQERVSGKEALTAFIIGTEILVRIGKASRLVESGMTHLTDGGHYIFGAVAAAGRILGLSHQQLLHALGIASTMTQPHSNAMYYPPTMMTSVHHGFIAQDAINCCLLAQRGITGPTGQILTGPYGYLNLMIHWDTDIELITRDIGVEWMLTETTIKPYASCKRTHSAVTGILEQMQEHEFSINDIKSIHIDEPPSDFAVVAAPYDEKWNPKTKQECQFSLPYVIAAAALDKSVDPSAFDPQQRDRPQIHDLIKLVSVSEDHQLPPWSARVRTVLHDDSEYVEETLHARGHPKNPLTMAELMAKFKICVSCATWKLDDKTMDMLIQRILSIEKVKDVLSDIILPIIPKKQEAHLSERSIE
jgi:2-methylcitrate dehydratase PrpD